MIKPVTIAAAVLICALPVTAQTRQPGQLFLSQWDADGDGKVTLQEAGTRRADMFAMFDQDSDGRLSPDEIDGISAYRRDTAEDGFGPMNGGRRQSGPGTALTRLDANADGRLSAAEFEAGQALWFGRMDRNGDGVIAQDDFGRH